MPRITGAEAHHQTFIDFLEELILNDWEQATVNIFYFWIEERYIVDHHYLDKEGNEQKEYESLLNRKDAIPDLSDTLNLLKDLTLKSGGEKWNVLQFKYSKSGDLSIIVSWDQELELRNNPDDPVERDSRADAELFDPHNIAKMPIESDHTSPNSIMPFYFIRRPQLGIKKIVRLMIEHGSELEMDDYEQLDFEDPVWARLDQLVVEKKAQDPDFKMMLDGDWDPEKRRHTMARFTYVFKGKEYPFNIPM